MWPLCKDDLEICEASHIFSSGDVMYSLVSLGTSTVTYLKVAKFSSQEKYFVTIMGMDVN